MKKINPKIKTVADAIKRGATVIMIKPRRVGQTFFYREVNRELNTEDIDYEEVKPKQLGE